MITINLPGLQDLKLENIYPNDFKFHPPSKQAELQNPSIPMESGIYFMFDGAKNLKYIGRTRNLRKRVAMHISNKCIGLRKVVGNPDLKYVGFVTATTAKYNLKIIEAFYIEFYNPMYNNYATKERIKQNMR